MSQPYQRRSPANHPSSPRGPTTGMGMAVSRTAIAEVPPPLDPRLAAAAGNRRRSQNRRRSPSMSWLRCILREALVRSAPPPPLIRRRRRRREGSSHRLHLKVLHEPHPLPRSRRKKQERPIQLQRWIVLHPWRLTLIVNTHSSQAPPKSHPHPL